jgi:hypothetical protein
MTNLENDLLAIAIILVVTGHACLAGFSIIALLR